MPEHVGNLISIMIFFGIGAGFCLSTYLVVRVLAPTSKNRAKLEPYECGETIIGDPWVHINIRYYIFAMLFLIFDIETVFMFPWAIVFKELGFFGLIEMIVFILVLLVGLAYPWKKGVLKWETGI